MGLYTVDQLQSEVEYYNIIQIFGGKGGPQKGFRKHKNSTLSTRRSVKLDGKEGFMATLTKTKTFSTVSVET